MMCYADSLRAVTDGMDIGLCNYTVLWPVDSLTICNSDSLVCLTSWQLGCSQPKLFHVWFCCPPFASFGAAFSSPSLSTLLTFFPAPLLHVVTHVCPSSWYVSNLRVYANKYPMFKL